MIREKPLSYIPDLYFYAKAIEDMRKHGMHDVLIACVITDIRHGALAEERQRQRTLFDNNPYEVWPWPLVCDALEAETKEQFRHSG